MTKPLFEQFKAVSAKQWKQKIQADLKGADYNDTLIWHSNEGINVKPFYHADDFEHLPNTSEARASQFKICQTIFVANVQMSNKKALDAIERGAESIKFIIPAEDISIEQLLQNITLSSIPIYFELQFLSSDYVKNIPSENTVILNDIIGRLTSTGNWFKTLNEDFSKFETIVKQTASFSVDASIYQNAGANMTQQLAYCLAHAAEYLQVLDHKLTEAEKAKLEVHFTVAVGSNYFFEIAKLRALRTLWRSLASEFNVNPKCEIFAIPTKRNKTLYDYNTNMLRTTTECMSAILGAANTVCNLAYDAIYHKDNEFGERIARNQLLILKNESYFDKVDNPADGAYYIETLTTELATKALEIFKDIEANGGFLAQLKEGTIQRKSKESAQQEQQQFDQGKITLLGSNKHPNPEDRMSDDIELYPFVKTNPVKTLIEPIIAKRLAETIEKERLKAETE
ncbi:methylmalonyl-CoA mutase [Subsaximicrobium wynnwilliamsii]|uniref:Methylmalonyl-CoA mutase n=1 Tax=Subsaximicrobium wynnwilliamsii TaxID=291179 RepID=A0A5C6ZMF1_9FLAO|nr:methylmalonyl-CoA mutase subunit beta [Subsaximicrobium wynnwilliamsii]TXD85079.1 methylmalonyl-CoA mutase [Subsaximicrobium wynnwilliamsii]TXD91122.1 methylmalonyl-CoA mutase [Subsaximicrobium wynnwilliamsii]TXE04516.1 methylmalonyl-CoA mutase [Subsaximicrobium wynnwilliamsii]